jgi:hypothetical protein
MRRPPDISFSGRNLNGGESESDSDLSAASDLELRLRLRSHTSSRLATLRTASDLSASRRSVGIRCPLIARSYLRHCDNGDIVINGRDIVQRRPAVAATRVTNAFPVEDGRQPGGRRRGPHRHGDAVHKKLAGKSKPSTWT